MKPFQKRMMILLPAALLLLCLGSFFVLNDTDFTKSEEQIRAEQEIADCIQRGEELDAETDVIPLELLESNQKAGKEYFSDADKERLLREMDELYECYSEGKANAIRSLSEETLSYHQKSLADNADTPLCIAVKAGVCDVEYSDYVFEGDTAEVKGSNINWNLWIEQYEPNGEYYVTMIVNRDTIQYRLSKQSGSWKILGNTDYLKEFTSDDFSPEKACCETLEEAIEAADKIDIDTELSSVKFDE